MIDYYIRLLESIGAELASINEFWITNDRFEKYISYVSHKLIRKQWGVNLVHASAIFGASRLASSIISSDVILPVQYNAKLIFHYLSMRMILILFIILIMLLI